MIQAVLKNKISTNVRASLKIIEDTLTSSVIGSLLLLPSDIFVKILSEASYNKFDDLNYGKLEYFEFWPKWNVKDIEEVDNSNYVEPDVFIRFENVDIIIEAKRYDDNQQSESQWRKEIIAYKKEYEKDKREIVFLAIGGIRSEKIEEIEDENVYKIRWKEILYQINNYIENSKYIDRCESIPRVLQMAKDGLELHGFLSIKWFKDLKNIDIDSKGIEKWKI